LDGYGAVAQIWRIKTNEELDKLIKHKIIVNYIKAQRLSWFGHVQRIPDTRRFTGFLTVHHSVELKFTTNLTHNFLFIQ
jgi:hypothetical protein